MSNPLEKRIATSVKAKALGKSVDVSSSSQVLDQALFVSINQQSNKSRVIRQKPSPFGPTHHQTESHERLPSGEIVRIDEAEDIEMAPKLKQRFLGMNLLTIREDNLIEVIEQIKDYMVMHDAKFVQMEKIIEKRTTEQLMGDYFKRIAKKLQTKDLEERNHKFKLTDPNFLQADFPDEGAQHLRASVEAVISKLDIIL